MRRLVLILVRRVFLDGSADGALVRRRGQYLKQVFSMVSRT